ncbi:hypothetical protein C2R22_13430 [Salinigranum rubrum]|uniref:Uncharacterized protein n=1 Tax=Salinigranum rubrum TaxID=755307 RepID=A0A2I8VKQ7_9EURY|nr:hypothetical protein [Salinigranum rubrum]AUV82517.1 hypothetical protein C2R22_13430 [Salinigranum rubrum]
MCSDCERTELDETTEGYEEALVEIALHDSVYGFTIDATDLRLLDYSPATEGLPQPVRPVEAAANALQQDDRGLFRVSRLQLVVDVLKTEGKYELAETYELFLDATLN